MDVQVNGVVVFQRLFDPLLIITNVVDDPAIATPLYQPTPLSRAWAIFAPARPMVVGAPIVNDPLNVVVDPIVIVTSMKTNFPTIWNTPLTVPLPSVRPPRAGTYENLFGNPCGVAAPVLRRCLFRL